MRVNVSDVRDASSMQYLVRGQEIIFNLAGQVSHIDSMRDPYTDLEINCRSQLSILEACRHHNPAVKVVFASTRQIYGKPDSLPVTEEHLVRPIDVNGINKAAGEYYHLVYNNVFGIRSCSLRLSNVYGPRQLLKHNRQGFIGWFIRLAVENREIQIFGDGSQLRDVVYVDDVVEAFLQAGASDVCNGEVFNVGGDLPVSLRELADLLVDVAGAGTVRYIPWPGDRRPIDIGSFHTDSSKFRRTVGWTGAVDLRDGLTRTVRLLPGPPDPLRRGAVRRSNGRLMTAGSVPWIDLRPREDAAAVDAAIRRVIDRGWFVLGPEVEAFEVEFAQATGGGQTVAVASGTDALTLTLRALGIGPGDEVITTALSAVYSAQAIMMAGARPVFADIDPNRLTLDPAIAAALVGPRTAAIVPVHLYGQPADLPALAAVADRHGLALVEDCCQAHLATCNGVPIGSIGVAAAYSFYPTKNLGALGDGGAVTTPGHAGRVPASSVAQRRPDGAGPAYGAVGPLATRRAAGRRAASATAPSQTLDRSPPRFGGPVPRRFSRPPGVHTPGT